MSASAKPVNIGPFAILFDQTDRDDLFWSSERQREPFQVRSNRQQIVVFLYFLHMYVCVYVCVCV